MPYYRYPVSGSMNATISEVPGAATHKYRVVARISTNAPSSGATLAFSGKIELTAGA